MEAKQLRQEHSVAKFASIALLHMSLDKKKKQELQRRLPNGEEATPEDDKVHFDSQTITLQQLMDLRVHFDGAGGALSEDAFVQALRHVGCTMSTTHLRWWFRRIDADESGEVDWHELSSFIISGTVDEAGRIVSHDEHPEDAMFVREEKGVTVPPTIASPNAVAGFNHSDLVTSIYAHPRIPKYFTSSQDGTVRVWDAQSLEFECILHHGKWVTSMCASADDTQLFIAGLDRSITVFELGNLAKAPRCYVGNILDEHHKVPKQRPIQRFEILSRHEPDTPIQSNAAASAAIADPASPLLPFSPPAPSNKILEQQQRWQKMSLEAFRARNERIRYRQLPDQTIEAHVLKEMEFPATCMACVPNTSILFVGLQSGRLQGYPLVHRSLLKGRLVECELDVSPHDNFPITSLLWAEFFDGFLSTASDGSVALTNIKSKAVVRVGTAATPIYHAVWMERSRLLATCGASREISLWSASPQSSTMTLSGHHFSSVVQLAYDDNDHWLISLDLDRTIVIWNMHNMLAIQQLNDYDTYQLSRFSSLYYDSRRNRIVCAASAPVIFAKGTTTVPLADPTYKGHQRPIVGCLYNRVYHQIVTADSECLKIWEASNGAQRASLSVASLRQTGVPTKYAGGGSITSIRFDSNHRRLIVGLSSATVCFMNMSNCHLVLECHRSTVRLLSTVDAGGVAYIPQTQARTGRKAVSLMVGSKVLLWEDKDAVSNVAVFKEFLVNIQRTQLEVLALHQQTPLPAWLTSLPTSPPNALGSTMTTTAANQTANVWRTPQPVCMSSCEGFLAIGTDCGIVLVYSTTSFELMEFFGQYDPKATVTQIGWHEPSASLMFSLSTGRLVVCSLHFRNKSIVVEHCDDTDTPVPLLCFETNYGFLACGDEDGMVHLWRWPSDALCIDTWEGISPFSTWVVSRHRGARVCEYMCSFRAHMAEISTVSLLPQNTVMPTSPQKVVSSLEAEPSRDEGGGDAAGMAEGEAPTEKSANARPLMGQPGGVGAGNLPTQLATHPSFGAATNLAVMTSSSDCQCRLFSLEGGFIGFVGGLWRLGEAASPRSVMRNIPAPVTDAAHRSGRSFLRQFLPGMQIDEPWVESVSGHVTEATPSRHAAQPLSDIGALPVPTTEPRAPVATASLPVCLMSPRTAKHQTQQQQSISRLEEIRHDARRMVGGAPMASSQQGGGGGGECAISPRVATGMSNQFGLKSKRDLHNPIVASRPLREELGNSNANDDPAGGAASQGFGFSPAKLNDGLSSRVTVAGATPSASMTVDCLIAKAQERRPRPMAYGPLVIAATSADSPRSLAPFPATMAVPTQGQVASMIPLLHLDMGATRAGVGRVAEGPHTPTYPAPASPRGELDHNGLHTQMKERPQEANTARLDEWRQRHKTWVSDQTAAAHPIRSARPMTLLALQPIVDPTHECTEASGSRQPLWIPSPPQSGIIVDFKEFHHQSPSTNKSHRRHTSSTTHRGTLKSDAKNDRRDSVERRLQQLLEERFPTTA